VNEETNPTPINEAIPLKYLPRYKCRVEQIDVTKEPDYISMRAKEYSRKAFQEWERAVEDTIIKALREKDISRQYYPKQNRWGFLNWGAFISRHIYRLSAGRDDVHVFYKNPDNGLEEYMFTYSSRKNVEQDGGRFRITFG
jgi:hypothetical protein